MFDIPDDDIKSKCEGADVFFCCLGTTRSAAGSAVRMSECMHACISLSKGIAFEFQSFIVCLYWPIGSVCED